MFKESNFPNCVAQHLPFLSRFIRSVMRGDQNAEDIVQQTLLKALTNADQFRFESGLKTWLVSIAINEARQAYRCGWNKRTVPLITEDIDSIRSQPLESAHNNYQASEREALVHKAVSQLPRGYRCVVELCDFQQVPMREAARQLGLTLSAVKSRRHRARQKLLPLVRGLNCHRSAAEARPSSSAAVASRDTTSYVFAAINHSFVRTSLRSQLKQTNVDASDAG